MLEEQDIKKIGDLIEEKVRPIVKAEVSSIVRDEITPMVKAEVQAGENRVIVAVGEMLEQNIMPVLDKIDERLDSMEGKIGDMQKTIANLPDKAYLDNKLADFGGEIVIREKKQDQKVNLFIELQHRKRLLEDGEVRQLNAIQVFPSPPAVA